ncbi:ribonuclease H-like domain-containing protein, partial [Collybia nuda]
MMLIHLSTKLVCRRYHLSNELNLIAYGSWPLSGSVLDLFANLLGYAEKAQHAFSASKKTTLHLAIPALESLHKAWSTHANLDKYAFFQAALEGAAEKVNKYYKKTNNTDAYIFCLALDPRMKKSHLLKHWLEELQGEAMDHVEKIEPCLIVISPPFNINLSPTQILHSETCLYLRTAVSPNWVLGIKGVQAMALSDFYSFFQISVPGLCTSKKNTTWNVIRWWGVTTLSPGVTSSSLCDHLAIMLSSVSSERAFSQGGITISKHRNRLRGDIVEALQCLKCLLQNDLIF